MSAGLTGTSPPCRHTARRHALRWWQAAAASCLAALAGLAASPVQSQETSKFTPFAEETVTTDDNVYRISDQAPPLTQIGYPSRGDTYRTTSFGLTADVPVSLQRFDATVTYNSYRYDRFHALDYDGYDLRGSWLWQIGRNLSGEVGMTEDYSLAPFEEVLNAVPDKIHLREEFAKGSWLVTPDWKLFGAADDLAQSNSDPLGQYNNVTVDSFEASLSRAVAPGNWLGLDTRLETGHFPVAEPIGTLLVDNGYTQYGFGVVADFGSDTPSHVVARVDQVSRHYDQVTVRDFDRTTGRIEYTWTPTGKTSLSAIAERDISPYEYIHSSIVMVRGITLRPLWHATQYLDLSADLAWLERSYLDDPAEALGAALPRDDHVQTQSVLLAYTPATWVSVQLSYLHETRSSNIPLGGYAADVLWLKARLSL